MMKVWYVLCVVVFHLSALVVSGINEEGMQNAITEAINNNTTGTFCLKAKSTGKVGVCVYVHKDQATWEEAQRTCTAWGGRLPEDNKERLDDLMRKNLEETNVAFLTTQIRFPEGTWLGGRMLPIEEPQPQGSDEDDKCNLRPRPTRGPWQPHGATVYPPLALPPPGGWPEPDCYEQKDIKCGTMHSRYGYGISRSSRCSCFRPRPYLCVTSKDNHTESCPNGYNPCSASVLCYKRGDFLSNWFGANQQCAIGGGKLPDIDIEGRDNITALMECAELDDIWTAESDAVWIWNHTGKIIQTTNWQTGQPRCSPMDCLKMGENGEWSAVDCKLKSNFMCIKTNGACENCEVFPYAESRSTVLDDGSEGINSGTNQYGRRQLASRRSLSTCQEVVIGVVIALAAVVIIFIILLVILLRQNRKYKEKLISLTGGSQFTMKAAADPASTTHKNAYVEGD